jgi:hypothetical protein
MMYPVESAKMELILLMVHPYTAGASERAPKLWCHDSIVGIARIILTPTLTQ